MINKKSIISIIGSNLLLLILALALKWHVPNILSGYWIETLPLFIFGIYIILTKFKEIIPKRIFLSIVLLGFFTLPAYFLYQEASLSLVILFSIIIFAIPDYSFYKFLYKNQKFNTVTGIMAARIIILGAAMFIGTPIKALILFIFFKTLIESTFAFAVQKGGTWY